MIRFASLPICFSVIASLLLATPARGENWPHWRGPTYNGICTETEVPLTWSKTDNVAWRLPLPGPAGATPVIWGENIFLTTTAGEELQLWCVDTSGEVHWKRTVGEGNKNVRGDEGNSASPSPSTDGEHVWTFMGNGDLACYDLEGNRIWGFNVQDRYGKLKIAFGMTSTPVLDKDRLYLQLIHGEGNPQTREAVVFCLDKLTGNEIWQQPRPSDGRKECEHSYASPTLYRDSSREFLITHGADYTVGHSLEDGTETWRLGGLNPPGNYDPTLRFVASPVAAGGIIIVPTAKRGPVVAIKPTGRGDITGTSHELWRYDKTPDVPSPLVHGGLVYLCSQNGNLTVLDAESGERYYENRTERDRHRASPVYADGRIYLTARSGVVTVCKAGKEFEILAQNEIGESTSASPAISNGTLYLRSFEALYAIKRGQ